MLVSFRLISQLKTGKKETRLHRGIMDYRKSWHKYPTKDNHFAVLLYLLSRPGYHYWYYDQIKSNMKISKRDKLFISDREKKGYDQNDG